MTAHENSLAEFHGNNHTTYRSKKWLPDSTWRVIVMRGSKDLRIHLLVLIILLISPLSAVSQTPQSLSVGDGTLTFNKTTSTESCEIATAGGPSTGTYTLYSYDSFVYTDSNSVSTPLSGAAAEPFFGATHCVDPVDYGPNPYTMGLPVGATISFGMSGRGFYSATVSAVVDPLYKVTSILYAMPGNASSSSLTATTTNGTTTTIGSSFTFGVNSTFTLSWVWGSAGITLGASQTNGFTEAFTQTIANATSIVNYSPTGGGNTISHDQDKFMIWLNPQVELTGTSTNIGYNIHSRFTNGSEQFPDIVQVTAQAMMDVGGVTHVPTAILQKQYNPASAQYDLPGLAAICVDQSQYVNNCPLGGQCGCVPSDFTNILSRDPLLSGTTATNPLSVTTSGASACNLPSSASSCRYVPVPSYYGSMSPATATLAGPNCVGCGHSANGFTQTDSTSTSQTFSESDSMSVSKTVKFGSGLGPSLSLTTMWTWTDTESSGSINGISNQQGLSLSSSTVGCSQSVLIYEDTVYHTFVTQQAPGNTSCP